MFVAGGKVSLMQYTYRGMRPWAKHAYLLGCAEVAVLTRYKGGTSEEFIMPGGEPYLGLKLVQNLHSFLPLARLAIDLCRSNTWRRQHS